MTIRLDQQLKDKLGRLADGTRRSRSFLAAEAVEAYVDRKLADVEVGRTVSHENAMKTVRKRSKLQQAVQHEPTRSLVQ